MDIIDLHTHSTVSDGTCSPSWLAHLARENGIAAFALTDHDNIDGNKIAASEARDLGVEFIPGMELTTTIDGHKIHVVTLGFEAEHPSFVKLYKKIRANKESKMDELIDGIRARGVDITMEKVQEFTDAKVDRYAVMRYMVALHMTSGIQPLWDNYLDPVLAELGLGEIDPEEAFTAIHEAGGMTSLAHYHKKIGLKDMTDDEKRSTIRRLHEIGLDGMEQWYPSYREPEKAFAAEMIETLGLVATGGTDYHGFNRPNVSMGTGRNGNMRIPLSALDNVKKKITEYHNKMK
ncbi:MAG: PHP domain-containing protein [Selenomonadaceae bacterium]